MIRSVRDEEDGAQISSETTNHNNFKVNSILVAHGVNA